MTRTVVDAAAARAAVARWWLADPVGDDRLGAISLRPHQVEAVARLRDVLDEFGGALLADAVGLGKTFVALALARDARYPLIITPAGLSSMWRQAADSAGVAVVLRSIETLGRDEAPRRPRDPWDLVVVDEAHHFRNPATRRYRALARLTAGVRVLLLSATPIHNRLGDLAAILGLFLGVRAWTLTDAERARCIVRRGKASLHTDPSERDDTLRAPAVDAPRRIELADDTATLDAVVALPAPVPPRDGGAAGALVAFGLVRQWASSAGALRAALRRRLARAVAMSAALEAGRSPSYRDLRAWCVGDGAVQLAFPELLVPAAPDAAALLAAVRTHEGAVRALLARLTVAPDPDRYRAARVIEILRAHPGMRVVAFSTYEDTVRALFRLVRGECRACALSASGGLTVGGRITRAAATAQFAPLASCASDAERIDLLLTTDLLSEGVNLQQAGVVVHLDLPWTPARMEQRVGRIARLGSPHARVYVYALMPPASAEALVGVERRLRAKLDTAGRSIGIAGCIVPPLAIDPFSAGTEGRSGPPELAAAARAAIRRWIDGGPACPVPPSHGAVCAAVHAARGGFLAVCVRGGRPMLLGASDERVSDAPDVVAEAVAAAEGGDAVLDDAACRAACAAIAQWWDRHCASEDAGLLVGTGAPGRRRVLARIADITRRAPPHVRPRLADLARRARRAATIPCGAGAEWVLGELAAAHLPDHAWLRAVGAFGATHDGARGCDRDAPTPGFAVVAIIMFVVPATGRPAHHPA